MEKSLKVLIGDNTFAFGRMFSKYLEIMGYAGICRRSEYKKLMSEIVSETPDVLLLNLNDADKATVKFIKDVKQRFPRVTLIICTYRIASEFTGALFKAGIDRYVIMPVEMCELCKIITDAVLSRYSFRLESEAEVFFAGMGIPKEHRGFDYLCTGVCLCIMDYTLLENINDVLYAKLAKIYKTTVSQTEMALRRLSDEIKNTGAAKKLIGISFESEERLTNYELITSAADAFADKYDLFRE